MMNDDKDKPSTAVALEYGKQEAPTITAKGEGLLAEQIIALAEANNVHLHRDEGLSRVLNALSLGEEIPEALYRVIAEIIAFVYLLEGKRPPNWRPDSEAKTHKVKSLDKK